MVLRGGAFRPSTYGAGFKVTKFQVLKIVGSGSRGLGCYRFGASGGRAP